MHLKMADNLIDSWGFFVCFQKTHAIQLRKSFNVFTSKISSSIASFSTQSSATIKAYTFLNNIAIKKKSQSTEQTDQTELACSVSNFL